MASVIPVGAELFRAQRARHATSPTNRGLRVWEPARYKRTADASGERYSADFRGACSCTDSGAYRNRLRWQDSAGFPAALLVLHGLVQLFLGSLPGLFVGRIGGLPAFAVHGQLLGLLMVFVHLHLGLAVGLLREVDAFL